MTEPTERDRQAAWDAWYLWLATDEAHISAKREQCVEFFANAIATAREEGHTEGRLIRDDYLQRKFDEEESDYEYLRDRVVEYLPAFCHDGDEAEPFIMGEACRESGKLLQQCRRVLWNARQELIAYEQSYGTPADVEEIDALLSRLSNDSEVTP